VEPEKLDQIKQQGLDHIRTAISAIRVSINSANTIRSLGSPERADIVTRKAQDLWHRLAQGAVREASESQAVDPVISDLRKIGRELGIAVERYLPPESANTARA